LTVAMIVFVLYMRYKEKRVMKKGQLVLMYAVTGFLCLCKVVYMPFCLFLFLIPKERFRNKKNYWLHVSMPVPAHVLHKVLGTGDERGAVVAYQVVAALAVVITYSARAGIFRGQAVYTAPDQDGRWHR